MKTLFATAILLMSVTSAFAECSKENMLSNAVLAAKITVNDKGNLHLANARTAIVGLEDSTPGKEVASITVVLDATDSQGNKQEWASLVNIGSDCTVVRRTANLMLKAE